MMGAHHAATGSAAWVAVAGTGPLMLGWYPVSPSGLLVGSIVCGGAAMLPDADHQSGTISNSLPPVSKVVTRAVSRLSGGHRRGTHSILGIAVATGLAVLAGLVGVETETFGRVAVGAGVLSLLLVAYAARVTHLTDGNSWGRSWVLAAAVATFITLYAPEEWEWLPVAVGLGFAVHIAGDMLTTGGVPLLWPWAPKPPRWWRKVNVLNDVWRSNGAVALPILGDTGSKREWTFAIPVTIYATYGLLLGVLGLVDVSIGGVALTSELRRVLGT
ncbi:metal-dependent hydrolase [Sanguibacter suaedae]|uniref:Metal-dependent hydrolase n=1 Tax=Sanguibacter suaedae TaxID=2795737 RepID=A0A934M729_9MICO|nr:metal-dependent hydrolase [Sanguibacter suaedae]MBI9114927.1 metal-dependent hydrolase [Sanguibacter suaedae]